MIISSIVISIIVVIGTSLLCAKLAKTETKFLSKICLLTIYGITVSAVIWCVIMLPLNTLVGDAEKNEFELDDVTVLVYYDSENEEYFLTEPHLWNPLKGYYKISLDSNEVEKFIVEYNRYKELNGELGTKLENAARDWALKK